MIRPRCQGPSGPFSLSFPETPIMNNTNHLTRHVTDKSGEPDTCDMCGFRAGNHLATCPLADRSDDTRNTLALAAARANRRRFTGDTLTGFGGL